MSGVFMNSTEFFPSDVQESFEKIGGSLVMDNGDRHWVQRVDVSSNPIAKRQWDLNWQDVASSVRSAVRTIANLGTTFTFVDEAGTSYTVQCEGDAFKSKISYIGVGNTLYYTVDLKLYQA